MNKAKKAVPLSATKFRTLIRKYYAAHKRNLPWRKTDDPYEIFISEIMLQQTQAGRVIEKYKEFIKEFPRFSALAKAPLPKVLKAWQGLGYNRRALYLKRAAEIVVKEHHGRLPQEADKLRHLPGVGSYTAAAIAAFAFNQPTVVIETNIRTVFIHFFFPNHKKVSDVELLPLIERTLDRKNPRHWYSALMDYGAMLKTNGSNHARRGSGYVKQSSFKNSDRQVRGEILRLLLKNKKLSFGKLTLLTKTDSVRLKKILNGLEREGMIVAFKKKNSAIYSLALK